MITSWRPLVLVGVLLSLFAPLGRAEEPKLFEVGTALFDWKDAARDREVPVRIYYPKGKDTKSPVIIFSHGLGGSRDVYVYLARYWVNRGFISVHVQHRGSDAAVWKGQNNPAQALRASAANLQNVTDRPRDISFAIDQLTALAAEDPTWAARLDLDRIGCAGHSFGANTAMLIAGQTLGIGNEVFRDPRVKATLALSEPVPSIMPETVFKTVDTPVLHMTGTRDDSPVGETMAAARRIPFDRIEGPAQYLLILKDGDHMVFVRPQSPVHQKLIEEASTAFWEAYLEDSPQALAWLNTEFPKLSKAEGTFEIKAPRPALTPSGT